MKLLSYEQFHKDLDYLESLPVHLLINRLTVVEFCYVIKAVKLNHPQTPEPNNKVDQRNIADIVDKIKNMMCGI